MRAIGAADEQAVGARPPVAARVLAEQQVKRQTRLEQYALVQELRQRGMTLRAIAAHVGLNPKTSQRWLHTAVFPERAPRRPGGVA